MWSRMFCPFVKIFSHNSFDRAVRDWDREVQDEAARLVREGEPPYSAISHARDIIAMRRKRLAHGAQQPPQATGNNK